MLKGGLPIADGMNIILGRLNRDALITFPGRLEGHIKLGMPEFYGKSAGQLFAVNQVLTWEKVSENGHAEFTLDAPPTEVGIDYHGSMTTREPNVLDLEGYVSNVLPDDIEEGHHTVHLDMSTLAGFDDPRGERTFVYSNEGWVSIADLLAGVEETPTTVWVGATYGERTVIWRTIARVSRDGTMTVAFAMDKGYALASDHPDWPKGLLSGCRWGTLGHNEERVFRGTIYFCEQGLDELRQSYARDFRPS